MVAMVNSHRDLQGVVRELQYKTKELEKRNEDMLFKIDAMEKYIKEQKEKRERDNKIAQSPAIAMSYVDIPAAVELEELLKKIRKDRTNKEKQKESEDTSDVEEVFIGLFGPIDYKD
jgi:metal-dependent amidase/aminoacylase/carboxypeptidase family protein